jgi:hypothetical protein
MFKWEPDYLEIRVKMSIVIQPNLFCRVVAVVIAVRRQDLSQFAIMCSGPSLVLMRGSKVLCGYLGQRASFLTDVRDSLPA